MGILVILLRNEQIRLDKEEDSNLNAFLWNFNGFNKLICTMLNKKC